MHDQHLFLRNDTILGACEAIGRDFGFNPNWLRVGFCLAFFVNPPLIMAAYVVLAIPVAVSRWAFPPVAQSTEAQVAPEAPAAPQPPEAPPAPEVERAESLSMAA